MTSLTRSDVAALLTSLLVLLFVPVAARAQLLEQDGAGYPLRLVARTLTAGNTYEFRTTNLQLVAGSSVADTVLTLVSPAGQSVAGADGCGGSVLASCFSYTVPAGGTGSYVLHLRAYRRTTPGRATVQFRLSSSPAWTTLLTDVTFGGGSVSMPLTASTPFHVHTRLLPGAIVGGTASTNTLHALWVTDATEWRIVQRHYYDGRVGDTAVVEGADPVSAGLSASAFWRAVYGSVWTPGPIAVFRNDVTSSSDWDGDGLSLALESHGSVDACDRPGQANPSPAFSCNRGERCATCVATGNLSACSRCQADLRDTDNDGIHDYVEWYGYDQPTLHISKWGAQPGHMDLFFEVDAVDHDGIPGNATCAGFTSNLDATLGSNGSVPFMSRLDQVFGAAPSRLNPDGATGIRLHLDVGVTNPDPSDTRWGNWGGGNSCIDLTTYNVCGVPGHFDGSCSPGFTAGRGWVFRYLLDRAQPEGALAGHADLRTAAMVSHLASWPHEIGHLGRLAHSGPDASTVLTVPGPLPNFAEFGHYRPNYPSRMNYRYAEMGGQDGSLAAEWSAFSFGNALLNGADGRGHDPLAAHELCPEGPGAAEASLLTYNASGFLQEYRTSGSCIDINWDYSRDVGGTPSYGGDTVDLAYGLTARWRRRAALNSGVLEAQRSAPDMAVANGVLLTASLAPTTSGYRLRLNADGDADCTTYPYSVRSAAATTPDPLSVYAGSYPACIRHGTAILGSPAGLVGA